MAGKRPKTPLAKFVSDAGLSFDAHVRGLTNTMTGGQADRFAALMDSVPAIWTSETVPAAFDRNLRKYQQRNADDARQLPIAKRSGELLGVLSPFARTKVVTAPLAAVRTTRSAATVGAQARLPTAIASNAAVAAPLQVVTDVASGKEPSVKRTVAAAATGALGEIANRAGGPEFSGAVEGALGSAVDDSIEGRPVSFAEANQQAVAGALGGRWGQQATSGRLAEMTNREKGQLGDTLSLLQSPLRGDIPIGWQQRVYLPGGGSTVPDWTVLRPWNLFQGLPMIVPLESKLGPTAALRKRQRQAKRELPEYRVDHYSLEEVADYGGGLAATTAAEASELLSLPDHFLTEEERRKLKRLQATKAD